MNIRFHDEEQSLMRATTQLLITLSDKRRRGLEPQHFQSTLTDALQTLYMRIQPNANQVKSDDYFNSPQIKTSLSHLVHSLYYWERSRANVFETLRFNMQTNLEDFFTISVQVARKKSELLRLAYTEDVNTDEYLYLPDGEVVPFHRTALLELAPERSLLVQIIQTILRPFTGQQSFYPVAFVKISCDFRTDSFTTNVNNWYPTFCKGIFITNVGINYLNNADRF